MEGTVAPLTASCQHCGGHVPVRVAGPPLQCPYCHATAPLEPQLAARVDALRAKLGSHVGREQLLMGRQSALAGHVGCMFFTTTPSAFLLFLLPAPWFVELPEGRSFLWFLQTVHQPATDGSIGLNVMWWYITLLLLGLSLVLIITALTALRVRRVVRFALPMPPVSADRPPRCRVCGAELPPRGAVRRCEYCSADSVVMGQRFQREQAHIDGALSQLESQIGTTLKAREEAAEWTMAFALIFSVVGLLGAWVAPMFLGTTVPRLLLIPLVLIPLSVLLFLGQTILTPIPKIPNLTDAAPGSEVRIKGTSYRVLDYLEPFANADEFSYPMVLVSSGQTPELLLKGYFEKGESVLLAQPYDVKLTGGLGTKPYEVEELHTFKVLPGGQLRLPPGEMVHVAGKPFQFRMWLGKPTEGQQPYATVRARGRTEPQDVVIIPA